MRTRSEWRLIVDPIRPVLIAVFQVAGSIGASYGQTRIAELGRVPLDWRGYLLLLVAPVAFALRRRFAVAGLAATLLATMLYLLCDFAYGPVFLGPIVMICVAVLYGHRRAAWVWSGILYLFFVAYTLWLIPHPQGIFHQIWTATALLLTLTGAEFWRARRERLQERLRVEEEESRRQVSEERLTMAQELHDVLAHNISLIHVQASTALHLIDDHPEQARTALATIKQASKDVLTEMRGVLSVLRDDAPRSPTAGLDRLTDLVERSGLPVDIKVTGPPRPLHAGVDRAAYRIVQESLTNVTRHAPGSRVTVEVAYGPGVLGLTVTDDGAGAAGAVQGLGGGNGIPGMRERATALGGTLTAGPYGKGFRVRASLPAEDDE